MLELAAPVSHAVAGLTQLSPDEPTAASATKYKRVLLSVHQNLKRMVLSAIGKANIPVSSSVRGRRLLVLGKTHGHWKEGQDYDCGKPGQLQSNHFWQNEFGYLELLEEEAIKH